jgi:hypothetical protein
MNIKIKRINMILLCQYYKCHNKERQLEINECLVNNTQKNFITKVVLFLEGKDSKELYNTLKFVKSKITPVLIDKQYTYKDLFEYANNNFKNEIVALIHSDILLCSGFEKITKKHLYKRLLVAVRHSYYCEKLNGDDCCQDNQCGIYMNNNKNEKIFFNGGGWDTYVFSPPIDNKIISKLNYTQNTWAGENLLAQHFRSDGYDITYPVELVTKHNDILGQLGDSPTQAYFNNDEKYQYAFPNKYFIVGTVIRNFNFFL